MTLRRTWPAGLAALLLAAHFLRAGNLGATAFSLVFPALLFLRRRWAVRVVQGILVAGSCEWLRTLYILADQRQQEGAPWIRMALILGVVAVLSAGAALALVPPPGTARGLPDAGCRQSGTTAHDA